MLRKSAHHPHIAIEAASGVSRKRPFFYDQARGTAVRAAA